MLMPSIGYLLIACFLMMAPFYVSDYVLSVLILTFYMAYLGQAWNLLLGFAGQLSFGHALYVGMGSYFAAWSFIHGGYSPWLSWFPIMMVCGLWGASIGFLGFRFKVEGPYFTVLTIAFAECGRLFFEHIEIFGGNAGLFLPIASKTDIGTLQGGPFLFYYIFLGLVLIGLGISYLFVHSRLGYFSQAVRDHEVAAQSLGLSTFWIKVTVMGLSAALTSIGGVFYAFYQTSLFPDQVFALTRSIELIVGAIVGGGWHVGRACYRRLNPSTFG